MWDRLPPALQSRWLRFMAWTERSVPLGLRLPLGVLLIVGGVLGFLPILGFWMIPLGFAVAALDVRPLRARWRDWRARRRS